MTIDEIYELVAANIYGSINTDTWEKALLNIRGGDTEIGMDGFYISSNKKIYLEVQDFDMDVDYALMELHRITTEGGSNLWNYAVFTLLPTGDFNIEFIWKEEFANN